MLLGKFREHPEFRHLLQFLRNKYSYPHLVYGHQGDYWIWVRDGDDTLELDNLTSHDMEIKCANPTAPIIQEVIDFLSTKYKLDLLSKPEYEAHEDDLED